MNGTEYLRKIGLPKCENLSSKDSLPNLIDADGRTNYPTTGDNLTIRFENSQFALFPFDLAIELALKYPQAWCRGGNHFGNHAFENWANTMFAIKDQRPIPERSLRWIKKREGYIARHRQDFRLAGIIAMIKWAGFVDGAGGKGRGAESGASLEFMVREIERFGK